MQLNNTYGLVICGGESSRMGSDKSRLDYHGTEQRYHVYHLLAPFCEKVFIACNHTQGQSLHTGYNYIPDDPQYAGKGPAAALLTAADAFPGKNFLVAGCDYPFLTIDELERFAVAIAKTTAFYNEPAGVYEPLLAWYAAADAGSLKNKGNASLQRLLHSLPAEKYIPQNAAAIRSIDTPEDYDAARKLLQNH